MLSTYLQYLLDYPSNSDDDDLDWLLDDDGSVGVEIPGDHIVDPDLVVEESDSYSSSDGNVQEDRSQYSHRLLTSPLQRYNPWDLQPQWEKRITKVTVSISFDFAFIYITVF